MINDNDYKSGGIMGRYGASSPYPSIDSSLEGAPYTPPGGATGSPAPGTKKMTGRPVASGTIPSGFSPDVAGAPASGQTVYNPKPPVTATNGLPLRGTAKSATEGASPGDFSQSDTGAIVTEQKKPLTLPDTFKGSNYDDVIKYLEKKMAEHKPLSEEELKKIRKRQKAEGIISGISDAVRSVAHRVFVVETRDDAPGAVAAAVVDEKQETVGCDKAVADHLPHQRHQSRRRDGQHLLLVVARGDYGEFDRFHLSEVL